MTPDEKKDTSDLADIPNYRTVVDLFYKHQKDSSPGKFLAELAVILDKKDEANQQAAKQKDEEIRLAKEAYERIDSTDKKLFAEQHQKIQALESQSKQKDERIAELEKKVKELQEDLFHKEGLLLKGSDWIQEKTKLEKLVKELDEQNTYFRKWGGDNYTLAEQVTLENERLKAENESLKKQEDLDAEAIKEYYLPKYEKEAKVHRLELTTMTKNALFYKRELEATEARLSEALGALKGMKETYGDLIGLIWKTHISKHVSPLNPPESCTICKDLNTGQINLKTVDAIIANPDNARLLERDRLKWEVITYANTVRNDILIPETNDQVEMSCQCKEWVDGLLERLQALEAHEKEGGV